MRIEQAEGGAGSRMYVQAEEPEQSPAPEESPAPQEWKKDEDGREYWYENGVRQGYDPRDPSYRGKEIYDPESDSWYWLDNVQQGAKAVSKDVYQESAAGEQRFLKLTAALEQEQEANRKRLQELVLLMRRTDEQESDERTFVQEIRKYATI